MIKRIIMVSVLVAAHTGAYAADGAAGAALAGGGAGANPMPVAQPVRGAVAGGSAGAKAQNTISALASDKFFNKRTSLAGARIGGQAYCVKYAAGKLGASDKTSSVVAYGLMAASTYFTTPKKDFALDKTALVVKGLSAIVAYKAAGAFEAMIVKFKQGHAAKAADAGIVMNQQPKSAKV